MNNYYYNDGSNKGPVSEEDLQKLYLSGLINANTFILKVGTDSWLSYASVFMAGAPPPPPPPLPDMQKARAPIDFAQIQKVLSFPLNEKIDNFLRKFIKIPTFLSSRENRMQYFSFMGNILSFLSWLACLVLIVDIAPEDSILLAILIGIIVGFFIQKIFYHFYKIGAAALSGPRIELSSMDVPYLYGILNLLIALICVILIFVDSSLPTIGFCIITFIFSLLAAILNINADKVNVKIESKGLKPSHYFINLLRYTLQSICLCVHILSPIFILISILCLLPEESDMNSFILNALDLDNEFFITLMFIPILNTLALFIYSLPIDIVSSILSIGQNKEEKKHI